MTSIELQLCDIQGRLFKLSARRGISSAEFIKVFMKSTTAKALDSTYYNRMQWAGEEYLLEEVIDEAGERFEKQGEVYTDELIYWIGYIYRYWHYVTRESSKEIYKYAPVKIMKQNYERLYMMTAEEVIVQLREKN
ncbi:MAG: hypothetical protein E7270_04265 [Lachnospiraceae bacterium]|nr:hypothetical protein [Lachnospiraceae bacterium]